MDFLKSQSLKCGMLEGKRKVGGWTHRNSKRDPRGSGQSTNVTNSACVCVCVCVCVHTPEHTHKFLVNHLKESCRHL